MFGCAVHEGVHTPCVVSPEIVGRPLCAGQWQGVWGLACVPTEHGCALSPVQVQSAHHQDVPVRLSVQAFLMFTFPCLDV